MYSLVPSRVSAARMLAVVAALVTIFSTVLTINADTANAAPRRCFGWSGSTPYKGAGLVLFRGYYDIEWCGVGNKVTEFRVKRCDAGSLNPVFVKNPASDCRPREGLNGSSLRIFGDMSTQSTVTANIRGISHNGGRLNVHYEITLYPDGRITGETGR
jgi:hypothetical protein